MFYSLLRGDGMCGRLARENRIRTETCVAGPGHIALESPGPWKIEIGAWYGIRIVRSMRLTVAGGYHFTRGIVEHARPRQNSMCVDSPA